jgi:hypothetical protein
MRLLKPLIALLAMLASATPALGAVITNVSGNDPGHVQFPYSEAAVAIRPHSPSEKSLVVQDYFIHDLVNQKGLDIRASTQGGAPAWAYNSITIENSTFKNIERREDLPGGNGLHIDHIRIAGGGNNQDTKINILIENVTIDGGDALPILITDGIYGTVTLRNVTITNTTLNNVQFKTDKVGSIDKIIIDNSPGLGVALIGRPGSVGEVLVRNSPDVRLGDSLNATGRTGAVISFIDAANAASEIGLGPTAASPAIRLTPAVPGGITFDTSVILPSATPVPEPTAAAITLLAAAAASTLRRRRRR